MLAKLFDTTKTNEFADWIVAEVKRAAPSDKAASTKAKKKHTIRTQNVNENIARRVAEFTRTTPLNIYKKASFAARVREGLNDHGYSEEFVRSFSLELIELIERIKTSQKRGRAD
jgi:isocitrate dehydrogenase kinase/phosphatase